MISNPLAARKPIRHRPANFRVIFAGSFWRCLGLPFSSCPVMANKGTNDEGP